LAKIIVNGVELVNKSNRGLYIIVINSKTGVVESNNVYDTHLSSTVIDTLIDSFTSNSQIIAAACSGECQG
jgi:hypothetical protein